jgi:D-threonate/D-erythronate kinase
LTSSYGQSHPRILILADDLTGACDAAVAFGQRGARTQVLIDRQWTSSAPVEVRAICTESRDIPVYQSIERLNWVVRESRVQPHHHVFKKIDSVFRGNTFHEIRAAIDVFPERLAVIAPSFPALGRRAVGGAMLVSDITGERSISLREPLAAEGVYPAWLSPKQSIPADNTRRILFCDAETDEDLDAIVTTAQQLQKNILWIGSGGLAHALAAELLAITHEPEPVPIDPAKGTVLVFAGSDHPVTVHQISTLREQHETATASESTTSNDQVVIHTITCGITTESDVRAAVAPFIGKQIGCLFMTGGDTAMLVCRALGIRALDLHREFEPGIPHATAIGGPFAGCTMILKSGGFGEAETISRIASHHKAEEFASAYGVRS